MDSKGTEENVLDGRMSIEWRFISAGNTNLGPRRVSFIFRIPLNKVPVKKVLLYYNCVSNYNMEFI